MNPSATHAAAVAALLLLAPARDDQFRSAPTLQELKNATYKGVEEANGAVTLANGKWVGRPFAPGGASAPSVTFVRDFRLTGDLDGDGAEEAMVLLAGHGGGTGETSYVAVVGRRAHALVNIATAPVGDRVQVRGAKIDGRRIVFDLVQAGPGDAACCPGELVTRTWTLEAGALKEGPASKTGRLSIETLAGTEWVLRAWAWDDAAPAAPEVTVRFDVSRIAGKAGCNNYFASLKTGTQPGDLEVGPAGATRMMCPEPAMAVETKFLEQLSGVRKMGFMAGQLALAYSGKDGKYGTMLFDRRPSK
jgi:heat shock protein HslJ